MTNDNLEASAAALMDATRGPQPSTTYTVQHKRELYDAPDAAAKAMTAWVDIGEETTRGGAKAAIRTVKRRAKIEAGRFRALPESSAREHGPRTEVRTVEVWDD